MLIQHATVLTGTGERLENADVLMRDGKVAAVGASLETPADAIRVDGTGKWVTPGIIDVHSHLGVYPSPGVTHLPVASMTAASAGALTVAPTAATLPFCSRIEPRSMTGPAAVRIVALRMTVVRAASG